MNDPAIPETKKAQKLLANRRGEATYLRFLRTKERVENFQTLKIIGKGAFGEVRLVSRKENNKIFALKSLIKSEMVCLLARSRKLIAKSKIVQERSISSCPI